MNGARASPLPISIRTGHPLLPISKSVKGCSKHISTAFHGTATTTSNYLGFYVAVPA